MIDPASGSGLPPDKRLVLAFQAGDGDAYNEIHDLHCARVSAICRRMLGNPEDAKEAAQETFLRVYEALGRFNGRYQLGAWIARIATNVCLDQLRSRGRHPVDRFPVDLSDLDIELASSQEDPGVVVVQNAEGRRIKKMLAGLPPMHRAAIVLRDFEGLSYAEIAQALELNEGQVKALLHRARRSFRRSWTQALAALIPWRLLQRARVVEASGRDHATQLVVANPQIGLSCSAFAQQCGQYVADRAAAVIAGVVIGGAAVGAVANTSVPPPSVELRDERVPVAAASMDLKDDKNDRDASKHDPDPDTEDLDAVPIPADEAPPPEDPSAEPAPTEPQPDEGTQEVPAEPSASPEPTPTEPAFVPEPSGFGFAFGSDRMADRGPCEPCLRPTEVSSEALRVDEGGLGYFSQSLSGSAAAGDTPSYGLKLTHQSDHGGDHSARFFLSTAEGSYSYSASGGQISRQPTEWGGAVYVYQGTYELQSRPSSEERMPESGTYRFEIAVSWESQRIVTVNFSLFDRG